MSVVSAEEVSYGVAESWSGGRLIGLTHVDDGDLMLRIEPGLDGAAVVIAAHALADATGASRPTSAGNEHRTHGTGEAGYDAQRSTPGPSEAPDCSWRRAATRRLQAPPSTPTPGSAEIADRRDAKLGVQTRDETGSSSVASA